MADLVRLGREVVGLERMFDLDVASLSRTGGAGSEQGTGPDWAISPHLVPCGNSTTTTTTTITITITIGS